MKTFSFLPRPSPQLPAVTTRRSRDGPASLEAAYQIGRNTGAPAGDFAAAGWMVLSIDYRPPSVPPKSLERDDAVAALRAARSFSFVDGKRVALFGGSRGGGVMASLASRVDAEKLRASGKEVDTYFPENGLHGFETFFLS